MPTPGQQAPQQRAMGDAIANLLGQRNEKDMAYEIAELRKEIAELRAELVPALRLNVKLGRERYQPNGGMCVTCIWANADCSHMAFKEMPVIGTTSEGQVIVRCTGHLRSNV